MCITAQPANCIGNPDATRQACIQRGRSRTMLRTIAQASGKACRRVMCTTSRACLALLPAGRLSGGRVRTACIASQVVTGIAACRRGPRSLLPVRSAIHSLVTPARVQTMDALRRHVKAVHSDEVEPTIDELRRRPRGNRISFGFNTVKASALLSVSPTALGAGIRSHL